MPKKEKKKKSWEERQQRLKRLTVKREREAARGKESGKQLRRS